VAAGDARVRALLVAAAGRDPPRPRAAYRWTPTASPPRGRYQEPCPDGQATVIKSPLAHEGLRVRAGPVRGGSRTLCGGRALRVGDGAHRPDRWGEPDQLANKKHVSAWRQRGLASDSSCSRRCWTATGDQRPRERGTDGHVAESCLAYRRPLSELPLLPETSFEATEGLPHEEVLCTHRCPIPLSRRLRQ